MATIFKYQNYCEPNYCSGSLGGYGRARRLSSGSCSSSFQGTRYVPCYSPGYSTGYGFGNRGSCINYQPIYSGYGYGGVCNQPRGYGCSPLNYSQGFLGGCYGGIGSYGYGGYRSGCNFGQSYSGRRNSLCTPFYRPAYSCGSSSFNPCDPCQ